MSRNSLKYTLNQRKYNLKFIIYLLIMLDIILFFNVEIEIFGYIIGWELATLIGLILGLRGSGVYRKIFFDLLAIRRDPKYQDKHELRGHDLEMHMDEVCLTYDLWLQESNKRYLKKKEKKNYSDAASLLKKNKGGEKSKMKAEMIHDLWYLVASIWFACGFMLIDGLILWELRPLWIIGIGIAFYAGDALFWIYLYHYQGIEKKDVIPAEFPRKVEDPVIIPT